MLQITDNRTFVTGSVSNDATDILATCAPPDQTRFRLFTDRPRSSAMPGEWDTIHSTIPQRVKNELTLLSNNKGTTLWISLITAFKTLLFRYTNQVNIVIAYRIDGSVINENGELLNFTSKNGTALKTDVSDDPPFCELLARVHAIFNEPNVNVCLDPSSQIADISSPYNVLFSFKKRFISQEKNTLYEERSHQKDNVRNKLDIHFSVEETNEELICQWQYNSALFDAATIIGMHRHFDTLLKSIICNPLHLISRLPLLEDAEFDQIIYKWNNTTTKDDDVDKCLHELFEKQVALTPDSTAVVMYRKEQGLFSRGESLTYRELNTRANQLAHYLQRSGVGPEVLVGICMERSLEMAVGILGILKSGGAYLPLDPKYPEQRINFMLKDACVSVLLTKQKLLSKLPPSNAIIVCVDTDWKKISRNKSESPCSGNNPENLAYVIYTSGSTGMPKGVLIMHKGVVNYLKWCVKEYAVAEGTGSPVNSSFAFDATVTSLFAPLLVGQQIVLLPEEEEIEALASALLDQENYSLVKITPAHLEALQHLTPRDNMEGQTKAFVIGGESLLGKHIYPWHSGAPGTRLINEYGPTETVVGCCTYTVAHDQPLPEKIPIGRPISNMRIYVLDIHLHPVPIGVPGEIYIGGAGVARGYLNQPTMTAERFIPDPFNPEPGSRLYKTGDMGRFQHDGNIIFLGRTDQQVKIRGYRIELGEIETAITQHPKIQNAVVRVWEDPAGDKHLVAYFVSKERQLPSAYIREFLREKLPEYMIPSRFIIIESLPLTENGKVDKARLPVPDLQSRQSEKKMVIARDLVEYKLTQIFENCLSIKSIGIEDDFFEMGGSSIQATRVFSSIRKTFGKRLPLATLLIAPTIEKLATHLRDNIKAKNFLSLIPIQPNGPQPPIFCVHGGWGNVLFYRHLSKHLGTLQPLYALQARGLDGKDTPHFGMKDLAADYIKEMRTVQTEGPYYIAGYCFGAVAAFEIAQQLLQHGQKVASLISFNGVTPNYSNPPSTYVEVPSGHGKTATRTLSSIISYHGKQLAGLSVKQKLIYPVSRIKFKLDSKKRKLQFKLQILFITHYLKLQLFLKNTFSFLGWQMPASAGRLYVATALNECLENYSPDCYEGNMMVFRSPQLYKDPFLGWKNFVKGEITSFDVPGDHPARTYIMYDPFVQFIAEKLKENLHKPSCHTNLMDGRK